MTAGTLAPEDSFRPAPACYRHREAGQFAEDPALAGSNADESAALSQPVDCPQAFS
jgi:hypothetical protein